MPAAPKTIQMGTLPQIKPNYQAATPGNFNFWTQPQGISRPPVFNIPWLQNLIAPPQAPGSGGGSGDLATGGGGNNQNIANAVLPPLMPPTLPPTDNVINGLLPMNLFQEESWQPSGGILGLDTFLY